MFSNGANNSLPFSEADLRRALASAEGQQILTMLRSGDPDSLSRAATAVRQGDYAALRAVLEPLLRDPRALELTEKLKAGLK